MTNPKLPWSPINRIDAGPSKLQGRHVLWQGNKLLELTYAGWDDWYILTDADGVEYGRDEGTALRHHLTESPHTA